MVIVNLIYNLSLLVALSVISGFISDKWFNSRRAVLLQGFLFGIAALIGMINPFVFSKGLIFDGRSVMLSLCALYFGPLAAAVALLMTAALRVYQGGIGTLTGVLVIISSVSIGIIFHYRYIKHGRVVSSMTLLMFGCIVHISMVLLMLTLPSPFHYNVLKNIALPVLLTYPLAVVLAGRIISENLTRTRFIEALKKSESEYRSSEWRLRTLLQAIPDLVWLKDVNGVYLACNSKFERFFGASESEIVGKKDYDYMEADLADFFRERDRKALEAGGPVSNEEWITYKDSGERVLLETIKTPMLDYSGAVIGVLGIGRDITERKTSSERIAGLLAEKELLLREVHHRIKNNMNTIKGLLSLQLLSEKNPDAAASLREAENRVQSIIMLYERLYVSENFRELPVKDYIESLCEMIISSFNNSGKVRFSTSIDDFVLSIQILTSLGIIINELITNAMKHAFTGRESGELSLLMKLNSGTVTVILRDNGRGIPDNVEMNRSTGFGLELTGMLVEQIGGRIRIERGEGTNIILEFNINQK